MVLNSSCIEVKRSVGSYPNFDAGQRRSSLVSVMFWSNDPIVFIVTTKRGMAEGGSGGDINESVVFDSVTRGLAA